MHFSARNFAEVQAMRAEMESKGVSLSARAHIVLLKTSLRTNDFMAALRHFREARALWAVTAVGQGPDHLFGQIVDLACKKHELSKLLPELKQMPLTSETVNTMLSECMQTKSFQLMATVEQLARDDGIAFT